MSDDLVVRQVNASELKISGPQSNKIRYLIAPISTDKKSQLYFLTLDIPEMSSAQFINAKGIWCSEKLEFIRANHHNIVQTVYSSDKSKIVNIMFPWSRVDWVQNLMYVVK
jgi:hypothetical protein